MIGQSGDPLFDVGAMFGDRIAEMVRGGRALSVTIAATDADNAYVYIYDNDEPLPVPLTGTQLSFGACRITPNVGSLSIIAFANGDENAPFFLAHSEPDKVSIARGKTRIDWALTPPTRDEDGDPVETDTKDELTVEIDNSTMRMTRDLIEFNGGSLGDLVVIGRLTARLNQLRSQINNLVDAYNAHTHGYSWSDGAGSGTTNLTMGQASAVSGFDNSNYNNEKIKQ